MDYHAHLEAKRHRGADSGFEPSFMPDAAFAFQRALIEWSARKGRAALFADCGLGKTLMQLAWAENVRIETGRPVLVLTPLAVAAQTCREATKFGIDAERSVDGSVHSITVANYERLHKLDADAFAGIVLDESSILKSFDGARRAEITQFMRRVPYRLLATATAAPNDYVELGTSSEALGYMGHMDMLRRFFTNGRSNVALKRMYGEAPEWRFKGHAEVPFWQWVTSWARACRRPSDIGFDDGAMVLPPLVETERMVEHSTLADGMLFALPAATLDEQRDERKRTLRERCEAAAALVTHDEPAIVWCHMNAEGDLLERLIPGSVQVSGADSDDAKEAKFGAFLDGSARVLVTKPKIGAWGLNFQHCAHVVYFPSHSYEQYYQAVRRCWRFGQTRPVQVDLVMTEGERRVMANLSRKNEAAREMFERLVEHMAGAMGIERVNDHTNKMEVPSWL